MARIGADASPFHVFLATSQRLPSTSARRYCGTVHAVDTPCSQYVTGGVRYLAWPALGDCCSCCTDAQGCGIVKPNWISADNGTYVGQKKVNTQYYSGFVDEWLAFGVQVRRRARAVGLPPVPAPPPLPARRSQPNYYWAVPGTGAAVALLQVPNDYQYFDPATYSTAPIAPSVFTLPSPKCSTQCPKSSICSSV